MRRSPSAPRANSTIASRLLPEVFSGFAEGDRITVLDLGPGNAGTLQFLSRFRARVFFADLMDNDNLLHPPEDVDEGWYQQQLKAQLGIPDDTRIDICLLWDYLHYVDLPVVEALSRILQPLMSAHAKGYGFGALHGQKPSDDNQYGIAGAELLSVLPRVDPPTYHAYSQQRITEHFPVLHISRGTLLREGRLELLFEQV